VQQNISYKRELLAGDIVATCEITGVHMDRRARKSALFAPVIRKAVAKHLAAVESEIA